MGDRDDGRKLQEPLLLGVCANASDRIGWNVWAVRGMWLLAALVLSPAVTGPIYLFSWFLTREG